MDAEDEQERQSDEDQGIGEVRGHLTEGGELGAHLGEPLRPCSCVIQGIRTNGIVPNYELLILEGRRAARVEANAM